MIRIHPLRVRSVAVVIATGSLGEAEGAVSGEDNFRIRVSFAVCYKEGISDSTNDQYRCPCFQPDEQGAFRVYIYEKIRYSA